MPEPQESAWAIITACLYGSAEVTDDVAQMVKAMDELITDVLADENAAPVIEALAGITVALITQVARDLGTSPEALLRGMAEPDR